MTTIRLADPATDAAAIAAIYRPSVTDSYVSFEEEPPSAAEMAARIEATLARTPWLVAVDGDEVVGYAYASRHRERAGYRWSVDISAYVRADRHGRGIGSALELVGVYRGVGYKLGAWRDVAWYQLRLTDDPGDPDPPAEPIPIGDLQAAHPSLLADV
jgi:L-amino acid N-acyltransferase YncA